MGRIANVLVNIPTRKINKLFSYVIPESLDFIDVGWRVWVPFGGRRTEGFVSSAIEGEIAGLKEILEVWDTQPWFDINMLKTAQWMTEYYLCSLGEAMRLFIPGGVSVTGVPSYSILQENPSNETLNFSDELLDIIDYIRQVGSVNHGQLKKKFGARTEQALEYLLHNKLIIKALSAKNRANPRFHSQYHLAASCEEASDTILSLAGKPAQQRAIKLFIEKRILTDNDLKQHNITRPTLNKLILAGIVSHEKVRVMRDSYAHMAGQEKKLNLTAQQTSAIDGICQAARQKQHRTFLLHGITGSGKTEVYLEAVAAVRRENRQAIVLVPEIALTSQIVARFKARFGGDVAVIHSKLSLAERHDAWEKLRGGEAGIAIGARSALFAPLPDLGVIILDEEHEFAYKQEEVPRYHAREVALARARIAKAVVVLGSATPAVESYYKAVKGEYTLVSLPERILGGSLPEVAVVDMRKELAKGNRSVISSLLGTVLATAAEKGEQAIILLNRRGYATFVLCRECGHVLACDHCSVSLVYHTSGKTLRCHYCQRQKQVPDQCPVCKSRYIRYFGSGTQKVEEEIRKLMPTARIVRMDQDTTGRKFAHDQILSDFASGKYDILLGTQMVAKGHDIPNVTAVGIISADTAINLPDFRAAEKTFALVTQAAGRAGRGNHPGTVVLQTYNPEHYAVMAAAKQNYQLFYNEEIKFRAALRYPPFCSIIKLTLLGNDEAGVFRQAGAIAGDLTEALKNNRGTEILGPFPAAVSRVDDIFRANMLIKTEDLNSVQCILEQLGLNARAGIVIDVEPVDVM